MLSELDKQIIRELQEGLPLVSRPYRMLAGRLNLSEGELLTRIKDFIDRGIIRRFGAAVRHQDLGFVANAMVVWPVPEERLEEVGALLAGSDAVTHCYARPAHPPEWPYNLFTMIHGQTKQQCRKIAARLSTACGIKNYQLLFSSTELKKSSMKYFLEN